MLGSFNNAVNLRADGRSQLGPLRLTWCPPELMIGGINSPWCRHHQT